MRQIAWFLLIAALTITACKKDEARQPDNTYAPQIIPANFTMSTQLTNPYMPV